jgi:HD-GYP domain-containing protein (c-di-GMP phosphodiesterase class II)/DNA-binding CsgD family transcriptional regulator
MPVRLVAAAVRQDVRPMGDELRLAELMAALSLATDLGMGQPLEQAVRTCLVALGIGEQLGLGSPELSDVYYVALLRFLGCTADAHESARMAGGDDIALRAAIAPVLGGAPREFASQVMPVIGAGAGRVTRARLVAGMMVSGRARAREGLRAHCEMAEALALRLGLSAGVRAGLGAAFEQWNGRGLPRRVARDAIPLASRIVFVARDVEVLARVRGADDACAALRARSGAAYDPSVVAAFLDAAPALLSALESDSPWDDVLAREPSPRPWVSEGRLDVVLTAFADFVDLKSPSLVGHSRQVASLVGDSVELRRAALVHDLGRVAVANGIWDKPGPLTDGERERVRLHAYYTERILTRCAALQPLAAVASMDHERLDGSGYHRGTARADVPAGARVLAAADVYAALTNARPYRAAFPADAAAAELLSMSAAGLLDRSAVDTVLTAAGHTVAPSRPAWPAGLTDREVDVLRHICRGATKSQTAAALHVSPRTVDHHVRHIYDKLDVRTRAGATIFALEHDLLT